MPSPPRVVVIGGGFGGLSAAKKLARKKVDVTLVDRSNHHLFQPLLYQVATGGLSPANIAAPLRRLFRNRANVRVVQDNVERIDLEKREVVGAAGALPFDYLILAAGGVTNYFGNDDWHARAPGLKSLDEATGIRGRVLESFERAELSGDPEEIKRLLTFVIVGGGPTGVEMAGAMAELRRYTLRGEFRRIDPCSARIVLIEASPPLLGGFPAEIGNKAQSKLEQYGVEFILGARVVEIGADHVVYKQGDENHTLPTCNVIWGAGVRASPLAAQLAEAAGAQLDRGGRLVVNPDLSVADHPNVFAIGDLASCADEDDKPLPGLAPVATQQGEYAARVIIDRIAGKEPRPFRYRDWGAMAVIGRGSAVAVTPWGNLWGWDAWFAWLFVHLINIVQFQSRILVLVQWGWNYATRGRSARLITGTTHTLAPLPAPTPNGQPAAGEESVKTG